jgi:hypothetical protein
VYVYGAKLEIASPRFSQRADFFTYICFVCFVILVSQNQTPVTFSCCLCIGGREIPVESDFTPTMSRG